MNINGDRMRHREFTAAHTHTTAIYLKVVCHKYSNVSPFNTIDLCKVYVCAYFVIYGPLRNTLGL